jgi:hypothetical protein
MGGLLGLCLLVGVVWLFIDTHRYHAYHDPVNVPNLSDYLEYYGEPKHMYRVVIDGDEFYGLRTRIGGFAVTVFGPPIFLYGKDGQLWDYNLNPDDAGFVHGGFAVDEIQWLHKIDDTVLVIQKIMNGDK